MLAATAELLQQRFEGDGFMAVEFVKAYERTVKAPFRYVFKLHLALSP
jgi:hypothetical protein